MSELALVSVRGNRRLYMLEHVGTLRRGGVTWRTATGEAGVQRWTFSRRGVFRRSSVAIDERGTAVGRFAASSGLRRGGTLTWYGARYDLRPGPGLGISFALTEGDQEIATFDGYGSERKPMKVTMRDETVAQPGLILFTAFIVRGFTLDVFAAVASSSAATSAVAHG